MRRPPANLHLHSRAEFVWHAFGYFLFGMGFLILALGAGVVGYHYFSGLPWVDALLNASMILTGMGPVDTMQDDGAKVFASAYAIFSGAVYPAVTAIILYPFLRRLLVALHLQAGDKD